MWSRPPIPRRNHPTPRPPWVAGLSSGACAIGLGLCHLGLYLAKWCKMYQHVPKCTNSNNWIWMGRNPGDDDESMTSRVFFVSLSLSLFYPRWDALGVLIFSDKPIWDSRVERNQPPANKWSNDEPVSMWPLLHHSAIHPLQKCRLISMPLESWKKVNCLPFPATINHWGSKASISSYGNSGKIWDNDPLNQAMFWSAILK